MKKLLLLTNIILLSFFGAKAQLYSLSFEKNYGGSLYDWPAGFVLLEDSSIVVAAQTNSNDYDVTSEHIGSDYWIYKIDKNGIVLWDYTYGGESGDIPKDILQTTDGGFVIAGYTFSDSGDISINYGSTDIWIIKISSEGLLEWELSIGGSYGESISDINLNKDSVLYFTGSSESDDGLIGEHFGFNDVPDIIFGKISQEGELLLLKVIGTFEDEGSFSVIQNSNGNYLIVGYRDLFVLARDGYITELSETGEQLWEKIYGGSDTDIILSIAEIGEHAYYFCGYTYSDDGDLSGHHSAPTWQDTWVGKIDSIGNLKWSNCYGGTSADEGQQILPISDTSFIVAGATASPNDGDVLGNHYSAKPVDVWIVAMDTGGVIMWNNCYGGFDYENFYSIQQFGDGLVVQGVCRSTDGDIANHYGDAEYPDVWLFKLDKECELMLVYPDLDNDTFGDSYNYTYACTLEDGFVLIGGDCDDNNANIYPGGAEILNGIDDDCNGIADEGLEVNNLNNYIEVFPTCTSTTITIQSTFLPIHQIAIYNLTGEIVTIINTESTIVTIPVQAFESGIYLIKIYNINQAVFDTLFVKF